MPTPYYSETGIFCSPAWMRAMKDGLPMREAASVPPPLGGWRIYQRHWMVGYSVWVAGKMVAHCTDDPVEEPCTD